MQDSLFELPAHVITFETFWKDWPNKVDRGASEAEWNRAMRAGVDPAKIIEGRDHYKSHKPAFQAWMHGRTFLHVKSRRWENRYDGEKEQRRAGREAALKEVFGESR